MWPWEHLAVGYLLYSATVHAVYRRSPESRGALALALGTQFPDLVDKPGGWVFAVLPSGTSVAHSAFVAVPVSALAVVLARRRQTPELGIAFSIGYLSHLFGDVLYRIILGKSGALGAILWPLVPRPDREPVDVFSLVLGFFSEYVTYLASPRGLVFLVFEVALLSLTVTVWVRDGKPGLVSIQDTCRAIRDFGRRE